MQVKHVDYTKSHKAIKVYEIVGMAIAILGIVAIYYGMSKVPVPRGNAPLPVVPLLLAATPGAGIAIVGTIILILTKIAETSIHSSEMTQQLLQIAIRRGEEDDKPEPSPSQGNRPTTYARSASGMAKASLPDAAPVPKDDATETVQAPTLAKSKEPEKPKPLRPLGGDKPDLADGNLVETYRDVKIYKRDTGIFIGSQWYPGLDAAKQAIDRHEEEKSNG